MNEQNEQNIQNEQKAINRLNGEVDMLQRRVNDLQDFKSNSTVAISIALALVIFAWVWLIGTIL